jgi:hypothetical protein
MCNSQEFAELDASVEEESNLFEIEDGPLILDPTKPQYKVITQKDRFFGGKFDPALIERALNEYAQEGWTLVSAVSADIPGLGGARNELVIILEKKPLG